MRFSSLFFVLLLIPVFVLGQQNRLINTHDWHYEYIKRLQQRGYLLELNPTKHPYKFGDIRAALDRVNERRLSENERDWFNKLDAALRDRTANIDKMRVGGTFKGGARRSSSKRLNVLNPLGEGKPLLPRGRPHGYLEWKSLIAHAGITFDWFYDIDPDGIDVGRRLYIRSEEAYLGVNSNRFDLYIGRFDNHWGLHDRKGAFITHNPRSFDQLQLSFGTSKLSLTSILGEMDNVGENGRFTGRNFQLGSVRRYLFLHRLDWSPKPNLKLTFMEGEMYYSETASITLRNLMPMHFMFFESHNVPMNNNSNFVIGGNIWYQTGPLTFNLQGLIDDLVVERREELREQNRLIPTVFTINSSLTIAGVADQLDMGLEADMVSFNSYRSRNWADQWSYLQRGLATQFSDFIRTQVHLTYYPDWISSLKVEPGLVLYNKGIGNFFEGLRTSKTPEGEQVSSILVGTVERTVRPQLQIRYQPEGIKLFDPSDDIRFNWWLDANMGINYVENADHAQGATDQRFVGLFRLFGQITF